MELIWRTVAVEDIDEAHRYIAQDNVDAADRVRDHMTAAERLAELPSLGHPGRVDETREFIVTGTPYTIAYTVIDEQLMILSLLHGAQDWPEHFH